MILSLLRKTAPRITCNICGGTDFAEMNGRQNACCIGCSSFERTRLMKLHLDRLGLPRPGMRVLHIAPEAGLAKYLAASTEQYEAGDLDISSYEGFPNIRRLDLGHDAPLLPRNSFDLIVHNHVLEHVECNITAILFHLHRALKPGGYHLFSIPFESEFYEESLAPLSREERSRRFGQLDHVRSFGIKDLPHTLGMVVRIPDRVDLTADFSADALDAAGIPRTAWNAYSKHFVFVLRKEDMLLQDA